MSRWTEAELAALQVAGRDYALFVALVGPSKTYDAFEVKSRRTHFPEPPVGRLARLWALIRWVIHG